MLNKGCFIYSVYSGHLACESQADSFSHVSRVSPTDGMKTRGEMQTHTYIPETSGTVRFHIEYGNVIMSNSDNIWLFFFFRSVHTASVWELHLLPVSDETEKKSHNIIPAIYLEPSSHP